MGPGRADPPAPCQNSSNQGFLSCPSKRRFTNCVRPGIRVGHKGIALTLSDSDGPAPITSLDEVRYEERYVRRLKHSYMLSFFAAADRIQDHDAGKRKTKKNVRRCPIALVHRRLGGHAKLDSSEVWRFHVNERTLPAEFGRRDGFRRQSQ